MASVEDSSELALTDTDKVSSTWRRIEAHLQAKLDLLRRKNDNDNDMEATIRIRAEIKVIKKLLAAGETRD